MSQRTDLEETLRGRVEAAVAALSEEELDRELAARREIPDEASRHLSCFIQAAWPIIEPGTPFLPNWHIELICEHLEAVSAGDISRLIINVPPRSMKSIAVSVMWPCWEWTAHPELRYLFCSYAASLSTKFSLDRRRILESEWYRARWPHLVLTSDQNVKTEYENTLRGVMAAASVGGAVTGKGGNRIVIDDPVSPAQAYSQAERLTANEFFDKSLSTRLDDKRKDAIVIVMQRIHPDDLTGHVLARSGEAWTHLKLPATVTERTTVFFPRSGRQLARAADEPLWPEREGLPELARAKVDLGSADYAAQYQQEPAPPEGAMIKAAWWRSYRAAPAGFDEIIQSWDMAFKDAATADFVVGQVWARRGADIYLLDQVRGQWDIQRTIDTLLLLSAKWPAAQLKLIEDRANGPAVIQLLQHQIGGIVPVTPQDSKVARCAAAAPAIEAGNVWIPDPAFVAGSDWVEDFLLEFSRFPLGSHDDQVDAATQALQRLVTTSLMRGWYINPPDRRLLRGADGPLPAHAPTGNPEYWHRGPSGSPY